MERDKQAIRQAAFLALVGLCLACLHHALRGELPLFVRPVNPEYSALSRVSAEKLSEYMRGRGVVLLDARPAVAFRRERIRGSRSLPLHSNVPNELLSELKEAKLVVIYCDSIDCDASKQLGLRLQGMGVPGVAIFEEGIELWKAEGREVTGGSNPD